MKINASFEDKVNSDYYQRLDEDYYAAVEFQRKQKKNGVEVDPDDLPISGDVLFKQDFMKYYSGIVPQQNHKFLPGFYSLAWSLGHSYGYYEVFCQAETILDYFNNFDGKVSN